VWPRPKAILDPDFNLLGIATTTGTACVALCVTAPSPPARRQRRHELPGPGNRANASIGRALQLSIRQRGRRRDPMSATWRPWAARQVHAVLRERNDGPSPPSPRRRGLGADASAIT